MKKEYNYVGPDEIRISVANSPAGIQIKSVKELENWIHKTEQKPDASGLIAATFVVDLEGDLLIADRHSEHIACAQGRSVLSAGEIFFEYVDKKLEVIEISNQSTGFCPEPESWFFVAKALEKISIPHPVDFTTKFVFRRCSECGQLNIVKEEFFLCNVCGVDLPIIWNCEY